MVRTSTGGSPSSLFFFLFPAKRKDNIYPDKNHGGACSTLVKDSIVYYGYFITDLMSASPKENHLFGLEREEGSGGVLCDSAGWIYFSYVLVS